MDGARQGVKQPSAKSADWWGCGRFCRSQAYGRFFGIGRGVCKRRWRRTTGLRMRSGKGRSKWQPVPGLQNVERILPLRWQRTTVLQRLVASDNGFANRDGSQRRVCKGNRLRAFTKPSQATICEAISDGPFAKAAQAAIRKEISRDSGANRRQGSESGAS